MLEREHLGSAARWPAPLPCRVPFNGRRRAGASGAVGEGHVLEADLAADRADRGRVGGVFERRLGVEQLEDLLQRGHAGLVGGVELGELLDRFEQERQRRHERHHRADRDVAVDRLVAAVQHDQRQRDPRQHFHRREVRGVEAHGDHVGLLVVLVELREAGLVHGLLSEAAHHADARQRLLQVAGDRADRLTRAPERAGGDEPEPDAPAGHERDDAERQQRQLDVEVQQHADRPDQRQARLKQRHHRVCHEAFQRLHVVGHARDQHARRAALVEADRLALQVREDADAQIGERTLADPPDQIRLRVGRHPHQQRREQERPHHQRQRVDVVLLDARVDRQLCQQRRRQ